MELKPFHALWGERDWMIGRTGYTGEDGFEIAVPASEVVPFWSALIEAGAKPCGLGARDTLRLEAGLNLYGHDMDEQITPLECGLEWTIRWQPEERRFIGREALEAQKAAGGLRRFIGLVLEGRGVLRDGQQIFAGEAPVGVVTSGGFSPTLNGAIALARVDAAAGEALTVDIRGKRLPVREVAPPFVRNGKVLV